MLSPRHHVDHLDRFLSDKNLSPSYRSCYEEIMKSLKELQGLVGKWEQLRRDEDYLKFRFKEFEELSPSREDYDKLQADVREAENFASICQKLENTRNLLDNSQNASQVVGQLKKLLEDLAQVSPKFGPSHELAAQVIEQLNELHFEASRCLESFDQDGEYNLDELQERLSDYRDLMRKSGSNNIEDLLERYEKLEQDLLSVSTLEEAMKTQCKKLKSQMILLLGLSNRLSKARREAADHVKQSLETELKSLVMPNAQVQVCFEKIDRVAPLAIGPITAEVDDLILEIATDLTSLSPRGAETVQFELSANPGEKPQPLHKVVSGGELSRIMLALKKALAAGANTCVLVFDEIDTGISGKIADVVGKKLDQLSSHFQIICISHLPQVAVYADTHFQVSKHTDGDRTETKFFLLTGKNREEEIARLLSGQSVTASSLSAARELLKRSASS